MNFPVDKLIKINNGFTQSQSQFVYTTKSKMGSQLLLASTSSHVQLWQESEKAFNECLGVSNVFPTAA